MLFSIQPGFANPFPSWYTFLIQICSEKKKETGVISLSTTKKRFYHRLWFKLLLAAVLLILTALSQLFLQNGLLFQMLANNERENYVQLQEELDATHTLPSDVTEIVEEEYNVYLPDGYADTTLPIVLNLHGGGLISGNKDFNRYFCAQFAQKGYIVYSLEYPLLPEVKIYEELQTISDEIHLVADTFTDYHGDPNRVYLTGDSAGGLLSLYTVALQNSPDMCEAFDVTPCTVPIRKVGLMSGMVYTTRRDEIGIFVSNQIYGNLYQFKSVHPYTDPDYIAASITLPPMYLQTSDGDYLKDYTTDFADALERNNQTVQLRVFADESLTHAFPAMNPEREETAEVIDDLSQFFS